MSTTIESLELEILSSSQSAEQGLEALTQSLTKLKNATKGGVGLSAVAKQISSVSSAVNSINSNTVNNLTGLANAIKLLSGTKISTNIGKQLTSIANIDTSKLGDFKTKITEITTVIKPLADEMDKVAKGFSTLPANIQKVINQNNRLSQSNTRASLSYVNLHSLLSMIRTGVRTIGNVFKSTVSRINNYIENMNLFTVSMGEFASEAKEYAETVSELMGIDPGEWMRAQGVFMTIATGFGVAGDRAAIMSKNLTQLGYDISSFYNISVEDAMDKLKSGLAGELEPLRAIGYDLSQAKLEATALALGIDKTVSSMTQAEKAQLRYYAIMNQVTVAQGDMARTLDDPANQLRILKAQFNLAAQSIGSIFIPALNAVLPYLIAILKVVRILASNIASLFGFEMPEVDYKGVSSMAGASEETSSALDDATESAKKLKSYMLGFDELNVINPNEDSSSATDDVLGGFDFELPEYDFLAGLAESKVNTIVEEMKEWLGITDDIDTWADLLNTRLGDILITVGLIGVGLAGWKITVGVDKLVKFFKDPPNLALLTTYAGVFMTLAGAVILVRDAFDAWENGVNWDNLIGMLAGLGLIAGGLAIAFGSTAAGIGLIIGGIVLFVTGVKDAIEGSKSLETALTVIIGILAVGAGIAILIGGWIPLVVAAVVAVIAMIVMYWDEISAWFKKLGKWFDDKVIQPIVKFFKGLWESVAGFFKNLWDGIKGIWNAVATWFDENVIQPIVNFFAPIVEWISNFFYGCWLIIQAVWVVVSTWFNENVIIPVVEFFRGLWTDISGFFVSLWNGIVAIWSTVSTWFNTNVIQPVVGFFQGVWVSVSGFFSSLWEDIKGVWNSVATWFNNTIIEPVKTAFEKACEAIGKFFSNLWLGIRQGVAKAMNGVISGIESAINWLIGGINNLVGGFDKIVQWAADVLGADWGGIKLIQEVKFNRITVPTYAEGGFPASGQAFIARENGIPEMVGTIGRRTAVANNDQIVESVASGVAEANSEQNMLLREQNSLLRALLEKDSGVYLDGRSLSDSVDKYKREQGRAIIVGGVL